MYQVYLCRRCRVLRCTSTASAQPSSTSARFCYSQESCWKGKALHTARDLLRLAGIDDGGNFKQSKHCRAPRCTHCLLGLNRRADTHTLSLSIPLYIYIYNRYINCIYISIQIYSQWLLYLSYTGTQQTAFCMCVRQGFAKWPRVLCTQSPTKIEVGGAVAESRVAGRIRNIPHT